MNWELLKNIPPWEWPEGSGEVLLDVLRDGATSDDDLLLAVQLAADVAVINDDIADALLSIAGSDDKPDEVRQRAAISLGPVLEEADMYGFEEAEEDLVITEPGFRKIRDSLRQFYTAAGVPKDVRRRVLEASVRAPQDWHAGAIRAAYSSDDEAWKLTAVFCMRFVSGFEEQILEALDGDNSEIHYEAVIAAGNWELEAAWPHIAALLTSEETDKPMLLAAIEAVASLRPHEAAEILADLMDCDDEDIADAVEEALMMARGLAGLEDDDGDDDEDDDDPW
jgi:hypothetical protein